MQPSQESAFRVQNDSYYRQHFDDNRGHLFDPLYGGVICVDITLNEGIGYHGLRGANVRPAAAQRVTRYLRHGKQMPSPNLQIVKAVRREVCHDIVVENSRKE